MMIGWHFYASNFQHLTKWKGSGFAMYTDSHPNFRSIVFKPFNSDSLIQVYPIHASKLDQFSETDKELYNNSIKTLKLAAFYPERYEIKLKSNTWTQRFTKKKGMLYLYRVDLDIDNKKIRGVKMYTYE
jgi:hypothetical protein